MSFQTGAFQSNAFQITAGQSSPAPTVWNTIYGGLWSAGGNTIIGRSLALFLAFLVMV